MLWKQIIIDDKTGTEWFNTKEEALKVLNDVKNIDIPKSEEEFYDR